VSGAARRARLVRLDRLLAADFSLWLGRPMAQGPDRALCTRLAHLVPELDVAAPEQEEPAAVVARERIVRGSASG